MRADDSEFVLRLFMDVLGKERWILRELPDHQRDDDIRLVHGTAILENLYHDSVVEESWLIFQEPFPFGGKIEQIHLMFGPESEKTSGIAGVVFGARQGDEKLRFQNVSGTEQLQVFDRVEVASSP